MAHYISPISIYLKQLVGIGMSCCNHGGLLRSSEYNLPGCASRMRRRPRAGEGWPHLDECAPPTGGKIKPRSNRVEVPIERISPLMIIRK